MRDRDLAVSGAASPSTRAAHRLPAGTTNIAGSRRRVQADELIRVGFHRPQVPEAVNVDQVPAVVETAPIGRGANQAFGGVLKVMPRAATVFCEHDARRQRPITVHGFMRATPPLTAPSIGREFKPVRLTGHRFQSIAGILDRLASERSRCRRQPVVTSVGNCGWRRNWNAHRTRYAAQAVRMIMLVACGVPTRNTVSPSPAPSAFAFQPFGGPFASQQEADDWLNGKPRQVTRPGTPTLSHGAVSSPRTTSASPRSTETTTVAEEPGEGMGGRLTPRCPMRAQRPSRPSTWRRFGPRPLRTAQNWSALTTTLFLTLEAAVPGGSTAASVIEAGGVITGVDGKEACTCRCDRARKPACWGERLLRCVLRRKARPSLVGAGHHDLAAAARRSHVGRVWTGGHVATVEKFAVTGLRAQ